MKRVEIELVLDVYLARSTLTLLKIVGKTWRYLGKISDHAIDARKEAAVYLRRCADAMCRMFGSILGNINSHSTCFT
jgi:hypothetical protein